VLPVRRDHVFREVGHRVEGLLDRVAGEQQAGEGGHASFRVGLHPLEDVWRAADQVSVCPAALLVPESGAGQRAHVRMQLRPLEPGERVFPVTAQSNRQLRGHVETGRQLAAGALRDPADVCES
jgi:hypothetical protein